MIRQPIYVYNNWSSYDELSDNIELTEELAMKELDEIIRLKKHGVRYDYYLMDAFWFDPNGGYRKWRKPHWPNGPDGLINKCLANGIKPGLWVSSNTLCHLSSIPEWQDSYDPKTSALCMFSGGFLKHFIESLQIWYNHGIRMYKFDFVSFDAATPEVRRTHLPSEIQQFNISAYKSALKVFKEKNPDVVLLAYNGLGGDQENTSYEFRKTVDTDWLSVYDSIYSGDPRAADVPAANFWRSWDIYSDHMVRAYELNGLPLERIDSSSFMMGSTGTCCKRGKECWKSMALLTFARGGWMNLHYGNLELLTDDDADWLARLQSMFMKLQAAGRTFTFGAMPGTAGGYGFANIGVTGSLYAVANPSQSIAEISLPKISAWQDELRGGKILFTDAGYKPQLNSNLINLGPEQLALVAFGEYADSRYDLGIHDDITIPEKITELDAKPEQICKNTVSATITPPRDMSLRVIMQQFGQDGCAVRIYGGAPPTGTTLANLLKISAEQNGRELPVRINYDKAIWSGLSWSVGEIKLSDINANSPIKITCKSEDTRELNIVCKLYGVSY